MVSSPHEGERTPYIVVEVDEEWRQATNTRLRRWVVVNGRGETVSTVGTFSQASKACAALVWWLLAMQPSPNKPLRLEWHPGLPGNCRIWHSPFTWKWYGGCTLTSVVNNPRAV
jgi:hypothetical protein